MMEVPYEKAKEDEELKALECEIEKIRKRRSLKQILAENESDYNLEELKSQAQSAISKSSSKSSRGGDSAVEQAKDDDRSGSSKLFSSSSAASHEEPGATDSQTRDEFAGLQTKNILREVDEDLKNLEKEIEEFKKPRSLRWEKAASDGTLAAVTSTSYGLDAGADAEPSVDTIEASAPSSIKNETQTAPVSKVEQEPVPEPEPSADLIETPATASPIINETRVSAEPTHLKVEPEREKSPEIAARSSSKKIEILPESKEIIESVKIREKTPEEAIVKRKSPEVAKVTSKPDEMDLSEIESEIKDLKQPRSLKKRANGKNEDYVEDVVETEHYERSPAVVRSMSETNHRPVEEPEEEVSILAKKYEEPLYKKPGECYRCRFCGLSYNYMTTLKAHERVHDVDEPYVCGRCGISYRYYSELQIHNLEHRGEKGYKCECGRTFSRYTDLLYHTHPGEETVQMDPMSGTGDDISAAKIPAYVRSYPSSRYSYFCQFCCKAYQTSNELKYHMYSHRGERQYTVGASRYLMNRL